MSERDVDILEGSLPDSTGDDDDTPIVILPDEVDIAEAPPEDLTDPIASAPPPPPAPPPPSPRPVPAPKAPAPKPIAARPAPKPAARPVSRVVRRQPAAAVGASEPEPLFSIADLELEIDDEISLDRSGDRRLFSMPRLCRWIALAAIVLLALLLHIGRGYYRLPLVERPLHYFHHLLRPSGTLGLSLGFLGAFVMLLSLAYLVRKSYVTLDRFGPIQSWMGFHILTGLLGPTIAIFHAGFVPTSALGFFAVSAMGIVVVSGIIGRYIAVYFPRSLEGREFKFEEIRGRLVVYRKKLAELGVDPAVLRIDEPKAKDRAPWLLPAIARVISGDYESRREYRRLKAIVESKGELRIQTEMVLFLIKKLCWERQWLVRYGEFRRLVGAWRFLHRWLAVVLFVALLFHVVVGMRFGGLWILGGRK
jgi:hypothetical protein